MKAQSLTLDILREELEKIEKRQDEKAKGYRDEVLDKMDEVVAELEQIREDQVFINHYLKDQGTRILKLEQSAKSA